MWKRKFRNKILKIKDNDQKHIEMKVKKGQLRKNFILNKKMSTNCIDKIFR